MNTKGDPLEVIDKGEGSEGSDPLTPLLAPPSTLRGDPHPCVSGESHTATHTSQSEPDSGVAEPRDRGHCEHLEHPRFGYPQPDTTRTTTRNTEQVTPTTTNRRTTSVLKLPMPSGRLLVGFSVRSWGYFGLVWVVCGARVPWVGKLRAVIEGEHNAGYERHGAGRLEIRLT